MTTGVSSPPRPRVLELELGPRGIEGCRSTRWSSEDPTLDRVGCWSGGALALARQLEAARAGEELFVFAVGEAVRRQVPTAARLSICARAPLTGLYADGQLGTDAARRLVRATDALVLRGRVPRLSVLVWTDAATPPELIETPQLQGLSVAETHVWLVRRFGPGATLAVGPAGELGCNTATIGACSGAGADAAPHWAGRGGLGAAFAACGLKAIHLALAANGDVSPVAADGVGADGLGPDGADSDAAEIVARLKRSPRLAARAQGGTLELFAAEAARTGRSAERAEAERFESDVARARSGQHGCQGCPTPCGWVFAAETGPQGARFGATRALGTNLGLPGFEDALAVLAKCDAAGLDAKELGAMLALLARARGGEGELDRYLAWIDGMLAQEGDGALLRLGSGQLARELGLESVHTGAKGASVRADLQPASLLGQCVASRGGDPMRTLPFAADGSLARLRRLVAPMPVPEAAIDPALPDGKGRLVWWHENWMAALDAVGFCAFSAAGILADGEAELDELCGWIAPRALIGEDDPEHGGAGARFLAAGELLVGLQRRLNEQWGIAPDSDRPAWARERLDAPGMWPEYRQWRGLDERGRLDERARAEAASVGSEDPARERAPDFGAGDGVGAALSEDAARALPRERGPLTVRTLRAGGGERRFEMELPAPLSEVLGRLPSELLSERAEPAVFRGGRRVAPHEVVRGGDTLELVWAISGG